MTKPYYTVIQRDPNSWGATTGIHHATAECPHRHRSAETAYLCREKLLALRSTKWFRAEIERSDAPGKCIDPIDAATNLYHAGRIR